MVKVYNRLSVPIEIRELESNEKSLLPALTSADIFCKKDHGCEKWEVIKDGVLYWAGSVPCKISGEIEFDNVPHYGETILPSNIKTGLSYLWIILLLVIVVSGLYLWFQKSR